jgi:hypothetical protein
MKGSKELKTLQKAYIDLEGHKTWPIEILVPKPRKGILEVRFLVASRREIMTRIKEILNARKGIYSCFFCNKYYDEQGSKARWLPMDKREPGDNGFGDTFVCNKCVTPEYGRL